jgi:hypothetical protein
LKYIFLIFIGISLFILGCESKQKNYRYVEIDNNVSIEGNVTDLQQFKRRFSEFWEASAVVDFDTTYQYELPYLNFLKDLPWYLNFQSGAKERYMTTIINVKADPRHNDIVYVRQNHKSTLLDVNITEKWIYINGTWYHSYRQSLLPPPPLEIKVR